MGRVEKTTNPFRNLTTESCATSTLKWTTPEYDDLSRTKKVTAPDTTDVQITYGLSTTGTIGITKTITDQAGRSREGITDALGNMIEVIEDPSGTPLVTDYVFDTLGNLRKTTQGEQVRYFTYDSLGRVLRAKQVEQDVNSALALTTPDPITGNNSWTVGYGYDDNGNITSTTDARGLTINAYYDHLNRLYLRDYSDPAIPDVSFYYDGIYHDVNNTLQTATGSTKGKTTEITSSVSRSINTAFDSMGRLLSSQQITDGQAYPFQYAYNLSGALISETYPSGRVVQNTLNSDGQLQQVQSKKDANHGFWTYAYSFSYDATGAVTKMQLGNGHWETAEYNDRQQVTKIGLGTTDGLKNLLELDFGYTGADPANTIGDRNNGSMRSQTIKVPAVGSNPAFEADQTYVYDSLNRIQSATETVSGTQTWKQEFSYDRYGNRNFVTGTGHTTTLGSCTAAVCNPTISTANNRFSSGQGYFYDPDGDITQDAAGQRFGYDSENRQNAFFASTNGGSTPDATYAYDGSGQRVKKVAATETTVFVYDASGQLAAEYSTQIASTPEVSYLTMDHLGSPRIVTDQNGAVTSRKDFTAFGETVTSSQRLSGIDGNGYDSPSLRQDYTGYQKDDESGLEYSQARYYNSAHGRFSSPDPLPESAAIKNPQTFNRYAYVVNSPYKFVDPLGLMLSDIGVFQTTDGFEARRAEQQSLRDYQEAINQSYRDEHPELFPQSQNQTRSSTANVNRTEDVYYNVSGENAGEAMRNANSMTAPGEGCPPNHAGCTSVTMTKSLGHPKSSSVKKVKGGYEVTEDPSSFDPNVNATITVYLPHWTGYDLSSTSQAERDAWDKKLADLKDHEEGHVEIATQEANKTAEQVSAALPASRTFITQSGTTKGITDALARRYQQANRIASEGYTRWRARDINYDKLTKNGEIPRSSVKY